MSRQQPALWWPIVRSSAADAMQNTYLEFRIKEGSDPTATCYGTDTDYTTQISSGGSVETPHGFIVNLTTQTETLPYPSGETAWRSIYRYCAAIKAAMEGITVKPTGWAVNWTISSAGLLTLTPSANSAVKVQFIWDRTGGAGTSYARVPQILGFDSDDDGYNTTWTGLVAHEGGFYLAADSAAALTDYAGDATWDVQTTEAVSIYGAVAASAMGGKRGCEMAFAMLTADQQDKLTTWWNYAAQGLPFSLFPDGVAWADMPMSYLLDAEQRRAWRYTQLAPGIARAKTEKLRLLLRG